MGHDRDRVPGGWRADGLERREPPKRPRAEDAVLALQRSAGNQAVNALLARAPEAAKPKEAEQVTGPRATLADIGTIALLSFNFPAGGPGPAGGGAGQGKEGSAREVVFSSRVGEHSAKLLRAALDGKPMDVEVILPDLRLKLKGAIVANYSSSGNDERATESWTLDFVAVERARAEGEPAD